MTRIATCKGCRKRFKVPPAAVDPRCRACGGELEYEPEAAADAACPSCRAAVSAGAAFCEACGATLREDAPDRGRAEERNAAALMRRVARRLRRLRLLLVLAVIWHTLQLLFVTALAWSPVLPVETRILLLGFTGGMSGLLLYGLYSVERRPFHVTLALALLKTLDAALMLLSGGIGIVPAVWAAYFWCVCADAAQLSRLAREHPGLPFSRRMRGEAIPRVGHRSRAAERDHARAGRRRWILAGSAMGLLILVGGAGLAAPLFAPDRDPKPTLEAFRAAWNRGDVAGVAGLAQADHSARLEQVLRKAAQLYEWGERLPRIDGFSHDAEFGDTLGASFHTEGGDLGIGLRWRDDAWGLTSMSFRDVKEWRP